jgi:DNA-binding transcriptional LysR family regulator
MNLSMSDLRSFVTVAHTGSFQHAASALSVSQPALTRRIQKLEQMLGFALFERSPRHVALTAIGREFLPKVQAILEEFDTSLLSIRETAGRATGHVTVACVPTASNFYLPKVLVAFRSKYPRIKIRIIDEVANTVLSTVLSGEADFGIGLGGILSDDVTFEPFAEDPFVLVCRPDHPLAEKKSVEWKDLIPHTFIRAGRNNGNRVLIDVTLGREGVPPSWLYEVQHLTTSLALVEAGLGITVIPKMAIPEAGSSLVIRPLANPHLSRSIGIIRRNGTSLPPAARNFYSTFKDIWFVEAAAAQA